MPGFLRLLRSRLAGSRLIRSVYFDALVPLARQSPLPSHVLGPVKRVHPSVVDWLAADAQRGHLESLEPASDIEYPPPTLAMPEIPLQLAHNAHQRVPQQFVAMIRNGRVAYSSFEVVSPEDGVFADLVFGATADGVGAIKSLNCLRMPSLRHQSGRCALIATHRAGNYYHWLNDCLTRLRALELSGYDKQRLIVPARQSRFQQESLDLLGFSKEDLIPFDDAYRSVAELVVPAFASGPQHSSPAACRWMRARCVDSVMRRSSAAGHKRIYISRAGAAKRRLLNEGEVTRYLEDKKFKIVRTESLSMREQIALAHSAEVIVAVHGAGLANAMFMQEGATVVELLPSKRAKPCFYSLATAVGLRYGCVTNAVAGESQTGGYVPEADFEVPLDRVAAAVEWSIN